MRKIYVIDFRFHPQLQWFDRYFNISTNKRIMVTGSRTLRSQFHCNCARLYQSFCSRFIWQWRHCYFRATVYLLPLGEISENWLRILGGNGSFVLFLHGVRLGWLRIHHQFDPIACIRLVDHGPIFATTIYQLHNVLHLGPAILNANSVCWFPTDSYQWAYGCIRSIRSYIGCGRIEAHAKCAIATRIQEIVHSWRLGSGWSGVWCCCPAHSVRGIWNLCVLDKINSICVFFFIALAGCSAMERSFLFIVGHSLCQSAHSHHRLCVWASADHLVLFLLRFAYPRMHIPGGSLVHHQTH